MKLATRRLPTKASIFRIVSTGSLTVVGFIPRGGRPIAACVSGSVLLSNAFIVDAIVYRVYDIVYSLNGVVYGRKAPVLFSSGSSNASRRYCSDSRARSGRTAGREPQLRIPTRSFECPSRDSPSGIVDGGGGQPRDVCRRSKRTCLASKDQRRPASQSHSIPQCRRLLRAGRAGFPVST